MPHNSPHSPHFTTRRAALRDTFQAACATFVAHVLSRLKPCPKHADAIRLEAEASVFGWVTWGPLRADGTARFADWQPGRALAALHARAVREPLRRRRTVRRVRVALSLPGSRVVLHAPRSLWVFALDRCGRALARLAGPMRKIVFDPAPHRAATAWDSTVRAFAVHVAGTHARRTANTGDARHVAALREAALTAVRDWVSKAAQRVARLLGSVPDLPAALLLRVKRAETAKVKAFTYWPASLLRAVQRALDLVPVVRVEITQTVRATA